MSFINVARYPKINLINIDFNYLGLEDEEIGQKNIDLKIADEVIVKDYDENFVYLTFIRKVFFMPEMFYNILVELNVIYELNEDFADDLNMDNLEREIEEEREILAPVLEKVSLLIGNITNIDDDLTIITPPFFQEDE
jgi:predicted acetyltransferase